MLGAPPFGVFLSELTIVRAGFAHGSLAFPLLLALLGVAFFAFARTISAMVTGPPLAPASPAPEPVLAGHLTVPGGQAAVPVRPPGSAPAGPAAPAGTAEALARPYRGEADVAATAVPLILGLAALLVLGLWIPAGLDTVLRQAAAVIG